MNPGVRGAPQDGRNLLQLSEEELDVSPRPYLVTRQWVKEKFSSGGRIVPYGWQSRVMGEFPAEDHDTLIPLSWIEAAQARVPRPGSPVELGVDVGWFGDAASVIALRRGPVVEILDVAHKKDTMATAAPRPTTPSASRSWPTRTPRSSASSLTRSSRSTPSRRSQGETSEPGA